MAKTHVVKQGECLSSIARRYGFSDYRAVYDHPLNADFKRRRPNPNLIYPGDCIAIPDKREEEHAKATGQRHIFQTKVAKALLRIAIHNDFDKPCAGKRYALEVEGKLRTGHTNAKGLLEEQIAADAETGQLTIWPVDPPSEAKCMFSLSIGHLDPIEHISGVQARLNNLGFDCGEVDGILGPKTRAAIEEFQAYCGIKPSGSADSATRDRLRIKHDGV
jgi:N-acetylmuramoyl-L-alanine amidase